jgi:ZIP family zinc transporter/zinc and cadmium transporter
VTAFLVAALAAVGFSSVALLALLGRGASPALQSCATAAAAGILLALAFGDLFPESLRMSQGAAVVGFLGGFAGLFLAETLTHSHAHPSDDEPSHNSADGFVLGVGAKAAAVTAVGVLDLGVLVHQVPVGGALAAVLVAAQSSRARVAGTAVALGLVIPVAAGLTLALPTPSEGSLGLLLGVAGGVLAYVSAAHLLPEVHAERPNRASGLVFFAVLILTILGLFTFLGD